MQFYVYFRNLHSPTNNPHSTPLRPPDPLPVPQQLHLPLAPRVQHPRSLSAHLLTYLPPCAMQYRIPGIRALTLDFVLRARPISGGGGVQHRP